MERKERIEEIKERREKLRVRLRKMQKEEKNVNYVCRKV